MADWVISFAPLSWALVHDQAADTAHGAVVVMSGMVRQANAGRAVVNLEYQAYEPMALAVFKAIGARAQAHWPQVGRVVIHHRVGKLQVGEVAVLVAAGSAHRAEAFAACQFVIDALKREAPIWKREYFLLADGRVQGEWVRGCC